MAKRANIRPSSSVAPSVMAPVAAKPAPAPRPAEPRSTPGRPEVTIKLTHDQIAKRAYMIWLAKGKPEGKDRENWLEAVSQLSTAAVK